MTEFVQLTEKKTNKGGTNALCGPKSSNICVIVFTEEASEKEQLASLQPAILNFLQDPVSFTYIRRTDEPYIFSSVFEGNSAVLYKPKRNKFMSLPASSAEELKSTISDALGGGGSWSKSKELQWGQQAAVNDEL